jgi:N-acyl-D-aspartate/D-glutamate deacylase
MDRNRGRERRKRRLAVLGLVLALALGGCGSESDGASLDLVLAGGRVMDPESGLDAVRNLGIRDGQIAALSVEPLQGREVVDVTGLVVAPGFIDLHAHGQDSLGSVLQAHDGVTTQLELESGVYPVPEWYASRDGRVPIHYGASASHQGARLATMHDGFALGHGATGASAMEALGPRPDGLYRQATDAEIEEIGRRLAEAVDRGAIGIGFGINYTPGASPEEIRRLFAVAAEKDVPAFVHTRAFGLDAIREAVEHAEATGAALHVVHVASSAYCCVDQALDIIRQARERGVDVTTEVYPYTAASTRLESAIFDPGWQEALGIDYGNLEWPATGERLTAESFERYRSLGGWVVIHMMPEDAVTRAVSDPSVIIASDGVPFVDGKGHPRGAGTFARVLGRYVREQQALSLMDALRKMTLLPARRLEKAAPEMASKGRIRVGADADLTLFDPEAIVDRATFTDPVQPSAGIPHVLVGGTFVVRDGEAMEDVQPGRPIRGRLMQVPAR